MEYLEALSNKADIILDSCHEALLQGTCGSLHGQSLYRKLATIYAEEATKPIRVKSVSLTHRLLEKLVKRENLSCLIVSLYRGNEGFTFAIKMSSGIQTETVRLPYEDDEFLSYIDNEQLPPMILDLLDESNIDIYHAGCVIVELRDYRRMCDASYDSRYILLRPTNQSLVADIAAMTRDKDWTSDECALLEAELVKRTAPPLNLSPSPLVTIVNNKIHQHRYKFSTVPLKRAAKKYSQASQNRIKKFEEGPAPKCLKLLNFLNNRKDKRPIPKTAPPKPLIPMVIEDSLDDSKKPDLKFLNSAAEAAKFYQSISDDVAKYAKPIERVHESADNSLVFVQEYTLETERGTGCIHLTKLTIFQRKTDEIYFGELYVDRDYQEGKQNGSTCKFQLGSSHQVDRYIQQFQEIFTEEGRKSVKITHKYAGQPPKTLVTAGSRDKQAHAQAAHIQQQQAAAVHAQQQHSNIITNMNIAGQQQGSVVTAGTNIANSSALGQATVTTPQQSLLIVSNGDAGLKKTSNMVTKPITMNTSSSLLAGQVATNSTGQVVVGKTVLSNLLAGRSASGNNVTSGGVVMAGRSVSGSNVTGGGVVMAGRSVAGSSGVATGNVVMAGRTVAGNNVAGGGVVMATQSGLPGVKMAPAVVGAGATKFSLPSLTAQLNRPIPSYSQAVSPAKTQQVKTMPSSDSGSSHAPGLKALLAGTPSADNPAPQSRGPSLLERLTAQSSNSNLINKGDDNTVKMGSSTHSTSVSSGISPSAVATVLRSDSGNVVPPPNINIANITNIPGLNVGLSSLQNVQVSIGVPVPISLSLNMQASTAGSASSGGMVITSPPLPTNVVTKAGTTTVSSAATVMIANPSTLQQGQVVQLPLNQLGNSQLAAQLSKSASTATSSTIPILQVQGMGGQLFTSVRGVTSAGSGASVSGTVVGTTVTSSSLQSQTVQVALPVSQSSGLTAGDVSLGSLVQSTTGGVATPQSIVKLTPKQQLQLTPLPKQGSNQLNLQLQQKLMAVKRNQLQQ